jgi:hypothetical protein
LAAANLFRLGAPKSAVRHLPRKHHRTRLRFASMVSVPVWNVLLMFLMVELLLLLLLLL